MSAFYSYLLFCDFNSGERIRSGRGRTPEAVEEKVNKNIVIRSYGGVTIFTYLSMLALKYCCREEEMRLAIFCSLAAFRSFFASSSFDFACCVRGSSAVLFRSISYSRI